MRSLLLSTILVLLYADNVLTLVPESPGVQVTIVESEHIVSFKQYFSAHRRSEILSEALEGLAQNFSWRQIPRKNPGQAFPSDFSVLQFSNRDKNESYQLLIDKLRSHHQIRAISPQKRFTRKNLNFSQPSFPKDPRLLCSNGHEHFVDNLTESASSENISPYTGRRHLGLHISQSRNSFYERRGSQRFALGRRLMKVIPTQLTSAVDANVLWSRGVTGKGVKVAIFDTGMGEKHPHFRNVMERTDWTDEGRPGDELGHGTFVAGVIASQSPECLGLAPDAELFLFRVFTDNQVSYTSWFLDAFNYAIHSKLTVLNLSIGGPDFLDQPFVDKVWELTANNVILVSAIGNDGPLYGTLNNPADQMDVIGVGGIDFEDQIAPFSSRGMTTWELPAGYGRLKPDLVAYGSSVRASGMSGGCKTLSGTSVSSPVITGAVALLASAVPADLVNPASMKQVLIQSAKRIPKANMFEQGHGKLDLLHAYQLLNQYKPHASLTPTYLDTTECPYMWPYCSQPLFHTSMPLTVNVTILNGMGVVGKFSLKPVWQPIASPHADKLDVSISYSHKIWPWSGWLGIRIRVSKSVDHEVVVRGQISAVISSPINSQTVPQDWSHEHTTDTVSSRVTFPINIRIVPTPLREMRILWDQYHNLRYPGGYFPRDSLFPMLQSHQNGPHGQGGYMHGEHGPTSQQQPLDWHADHVHTNFRELWLHLRSLNYYIDVLGEPYTCFDAGNYGTLMIVDPEDEFFPEEIEKLNLDLNERGLNLIVLADWYNVKVMKRIKFFDENTQQWWTPVTGGSNIPALNELLSQFGVAFSDEVLAGTYTLPEVTLNEETRARDFPYLSGTALARFPPDARLLSVSLHDQVAEVTDNTIKEVSNMPILALVEGASLRSGRLLAYGDSSCFDSTDFHPECLWLIKRMLDYTRGDNVTDLVPPDNSTDESLAPRTYDHPLPERAADNELHLYSKILDPTNPDKKRKVAACSQIIWNKPRPIQSSGAQYLIGPGREIQEYILEREDKLAVGIILSSKMDSNYKLPLIFPICILIVFVFVYWMYFRKPSRRTKYKMTSPRPPTDLPLV